MQPVLRHGADEGFLFNVQHFCLHDGPGIRTTVFLKGCGLKCLWCCNPESQKPFAQLAVDRYRCNGCGDCVPVCPEHAISLNKFAKPQINYDLCTACGECVPVCHQEALTVYGVTRTIEDVFREVLKDKRWYGAEGGVSVSGGEPLLQPAFVLSLFKLCKDAGVTTCVETCGNVAPEVVNSVMKLTDYTLFDLKHMGSDEHRKLTGRSNHLILDNARLVVQSGVDVQFRMPLIPGLNTNPDNIAATARFLRELKGSEAALELMPYHTLAKGKYEALDYEYRLKDLPAAGLDYVKSVQRLLEEQGVRCTVSV